MAGLINRIPSQRVPQTRPTRAEPSTARPVLMAVKTSRQKDPVRTERINWRPTDLAPVECRETPRHFRNPTSRTIRTPRSIPLTAEQPPNSRSTERTAANQSKPRNTRRASPRSIRLATWPTTRPPQTPRVKMPASLESSRIRRPVQSRLARKRHGTTSRNRSLTKVPRKGRRTRHQNRENGSLPRAETGCRLNRRQTLQTKQAGTIFPSLAMSQARRGPQARNCNRSRPLSPSRTQRAVKCWRNRPCHCKPSRNHLHTIRDPPARLSHRAACSIRKSRLRRRRTAIPPRRA